MPFIQFTGLSGAGKSTLANQVKNKLSEKGLKVEVIDGDIFRQVLCKDLGFSKEDRNENIRRLSFVANLLSNHGIIVIMAAINPYEEIREEIRQKYQAKTVWINCELQTLFERDTKGLYKRASLPEGHPDKLHNLTGFGDTYETPPNPDLIINSHLEDIEESSLKLINFILGL